MAARSGNFFMWDFVAAVCETDPESCCPFTINPDNNVPQDVEDPEEYERERRRKGKQVVGSGIQTGSEGLKQHDTGTEDASEMIPIADSYDDTSRTVSELPVESVKSQRSDDKTVNEGARNENSIPPPAAAATATDDVCSRRKVKKIKAPKFRLVEELCKDLEPKGNSDEHAGPRAQLTIERINDSDDVPLSSLRKRKAAHCNNNKKQKALKAKEPKVAESETSSHGPKGLNSQGDFDTRKLQEVKCRGSGACGGLGGSEPSCSGAAAGELKGSTGPEVEEERAVESEVMACTLNQNPADFIMSFESVYFRTL